MPFAIILERIFMIFVVGVLVAFWKIISAIFSAIAQSSERAQSERESRRVFGKHDHDIEIYEPEKVAKDAD